MEGGGYGQHVVGEGQGRDEVGGLANKHAVASGCNGPHALGRGPSSVVNNPRILSMACTGQQNTLLKHLSAADECTSSASVIFEIQDKCILR